jgi:hypothetical protein
VLIAFAYTAVYSWPVLTQPSRWVWGSYGDALGNIFELEWADQALRNHQPLTIDSQIAIPFGDQLGSLPHEPLYYWTAVLLGLLLGPVTTLNLISLLAIPVSAWLMYRLSLRLTGSAAAAFVAGVAFGCSTFALVNSRGEPTLVQIWIFPMLALTLLMMLLKPTLPRAIAAGAAVAAACLVNFYYVLFVGLLATTLVGTWLVVTLATQRRFPAKAFKAALLAAAIGLAVPGVAYIRTASQVNSSAPFHRPATDLALLAPAPADFLLPPSYNPWLGSFRHQADTQRRDRTGVLIDFSEMTIPLPILVLAPFGTLLLLRKETERRTELTALLAVALLGLWLTVPATAVPRHRLSLQWDIYLLLPYFRAFHRAVIMVELAAAALAATALSWLLARRPKLLAPLVSIATVLILVENFIIPPDAVLEANAPPEYSWLNAHPGDYAIAEYPLLPQGWGGGNEYTYQFNRRFHGHPLLNGHTPGTESESMREELRDPNRDGVASRLSALGVRYLIWHPDIVDRMALISESLRKPLEDQRPVPIGYRLEATLPDRAEVWSVVASPQSFAFMARGFGAVVPGPTGAVRMMQMTVAQIDIYGIRTESGELTLRCQSNVVRSVEMLRNNEPVGSWTASPGTALVLSVPAEIKAGIARLTLKASTNGLNCGLPRVISAGSSGP